MHNVDKFGKQHPDTQYVAGRIASKNRQEFVKGKWTARLRVRNSGQPGMFPAWWLLGARTNEPPVEEPDENICWPMTGSGEIDIFEHHSDGGPDHYAARAIKSLGYCDGGDWQALMLVQETTLDEYHEYSVEWAGKSLVYRLDGVEVYRNADQGDQFPEPMFAILNFESRLGYGSRLGKTRIPAIGNGSAIAFQSAPNHGSALSKISD